MTVGEQIVWVVGNDRRQQSCGSYDNDIIEQRWIYKVFDPYEGAYSQGSLPYGFSATGILNVTMGDTADVHVHGHCGRGIFFNDQFQLGDKAEHVLWRSMSGRITARFREYLSFWQPMQYKGFANHGFLYGLVTECSHSLYENPFFSHIYRYTIMRVPGQRVKNSKIY